MTIEAVVQPRVHSDDVKGTIRELQAETFGIVLPFLVLAGYVFLVNFRQFERAAYADLSAFVLITAPFVVWNTRKLHYVASVWAIVMLSISTAILVSITSPFEVIICLLALPVGVLAIYIGVGAGILGAAASTWAILLLGYGLGSYQPVLIVISLIAMWGVLGLVWITMRPLWTAMQWYSTSHEQNLQRLEETLDAQQRLRETLDDLANANLQLTRLNSLAQALRGTAEEARKIKETFVANVSHELRTPLNMIIGFCEMIVQSPDVYGVGLPRKLMADLDVILRNSQHLSRLVDDVLDLSQIDAGEMALTRERMSLHQTIEAAAIAVRPLFESKKLYLDVAVPGNVPRLYCDSTRIRQVVINLLSNAGRFTSQGGVKVTAYQDGDYIVVSVADTGHGIAADAKDKIFQPFHQLDGSVRREYGGSGLGLSVSRKFIEMHGGRIWFESAEGQGTTFFFNLPINPPTTQEHDAGRWFSPYLYYEERTRPSRAPLAVEKPRFVVLESGGSLTRMLNRYLNGAEITSVTGLAAAAEELARTPARAMVVNSASVSKMMDQITESGILPYGVPAIICSVPDTQSTAESIGLVDYLVKPVPRDVLLETVKGLIPDNGTLLVVDDEPDTLQLFRRILTSPDRGYRVLAAREGQEAFNVTRDYHPDAIFLDLLMEGRDGFWFLAQKAGAPDIADIPVVAISARDPEGQAIVTNALAVTRGGELSVRQLLHCIQELSSFLSAGAERGSPASLKASDG
ncbi:MAG: hybrid sensor histidine kinase/response regulator [Chloroflexi bacterium]|nr:hybrid sensor histidine kinase/response regulator [Chloroflexota bacterium]